jgi:hypothetical protein
MPAGPGAATPLLLAVYTNVAQGTKAPTSIVENANQYVTMPADSVVFDIQIPFTSSLQIALETYDPADGGPSNTFSLPGVGGLSTRQMSSSNAEGSLS